MKHVNIQIPLAYLSLCTFIYLVVVSPEIYYILIFYNENKKNVLFHQNLYCFCLMGINVYKVIKFHLYFVYKVD